MFLQRGCEDKVHVVVYEGQGVTWSCHGRPKVASVSRAWHTPLLVDINFVKQKWGAHSFKIKVRFFLSIKVKLDFS